MLISGIILIILVTCIIWACLDVGARNDGEYHRCNIKVTYYYNADGNYDLYQWEDKDKKVLILDAYRAQSPPPEAAGTNTFYAEMYNVSVLETKGGIIWEG